MANKYKKKEENLNNVHDVDTYGQVISYNNDKLYGRQKIVLNASKSDFEENPLDFFVKYIGTINSLHRQNVSDFRELYKNYIAKQKILDKVRPNGDQKINNKVAMPLSWQFVNFKKGYYVGKPIKYVNTDINVDENETRLFLSYIEDSQKASKDIEKYENLLVTGLAYTMTIPKRHSYDIEEESPFEYIILDNETTCVVRSSEVGKPIIFSMCFSEIQIDNDGTTNKIYTLYWDNKSCQIKYDGSKYVYHRGIKIEPISNCITEYELNPRRLGVFEILINTLDNLNNVRSLQLDQVEEFVNAYLTFENVDVASITNNIDTFREKRFLAVKTNNSQAPAKINSITLPLDHSAINTLYNDMEQRAFDVVGVPMATSNSAKGVSGEAQETGGGWENAQSMASIDLTFINRSEKEDLKKMIIICKNAVNSKTKNLKARYFEVKHIINKSHNMMVKSQSMKYFVDSGFTRTQALDFCEITDDPQAQGKIADENAIENEKRLLQNEIIKSQSTSNNNYSNQD